jgi:hypothetical protein
MTIEHKDIPSAQRHEPKGIEASSSGEVYVSDGTGSGDWENNRTDSYSGVIADISTAETIYIPIAYAGEVVRVITVIDTAISAADATVTPKDSSGNSMGDITVEYSGSAAGDVDTLTPASNSTVTNNDYITVETDGGSTTASKCYVTVIVERS